jgi:hypothetical protein
MRFAKSLVIGELDPQRVPYPPEIVTLILAV